MSNISAYNLAQVCNAVNASITYDNNAENLVPQEAGGLCLVLALLLLLSVYGTTRALGHLVAATVILKGVRFNLQFGAQMSVLWVDVVVVVVVVFAVCFHLRLM